MKMHNLILLLFMTTAVLGCKKENNPDHPDLEDGLYAEFKTSEGDFIIDLNYEKAPITVANFVSLAEGNNPKVDDKFKDEPFYDGLTFHRIIDDFMIQGGDPDGDGTGGPGYQFPDETDNGLVHEGKGILSMANAGPNTNGSQFFITLAPQPRLDGMHTVFGKVTEGQDIVDQIGKVEVGAQDKPKDDITIEKVNIYKIGKEAKNFEAAEVFEKEIDKLEEKEKKEQKELKKEMDDLGDGFEETDSGLMYKITDENKDGKKPKPGQTVHAYYKGMLKDGKVFDENKKSNEKPLKFEVGVGRVIPGWDEGLQLMREGEKARFIIPPHIGYGERGAGNDIPPNAILIFDVELKKVE